MPAEIPHSDTLSVSTDHADHPDMQLITRLCHQGLANFSINTEILQNWQVELSDSASNREHLASAILQEVILQFPQTSLHFDRSHRDSVISCLKHLNLLDSNVYFDFQLIVQELIYQAATSSYTSKIQLQRVRLVPALVDDLLSYLDHLPAEISKQHRMIAASKLSLLVSFLELGCEVKLLKRLVNPLFSKSTRVPAQVKQLYLDLLILSLEQFPSHFTFLVFNNFLEKTLAIPFANDFGLLKCFTLSCWFKINCITQSVSSDTDISIVTLFLLANASNGDPTILKVQLINFNQFMVEIQNKSTGSRMQFSFNQILQNTPNSNEGYTHFTLTYDTYENLNLFIDGDYSESIPCSQLAKTISSWNKIYIGQFPDEESGFNAFNRKELLIKDLNVLSIPLPYEWISMVYALGIGFNWSNKDFSDENISNFVSSLSSKTFVQLGFRCREIIDVKSQSHSSGSQLLHQSALPSIRGHSKIKSDIADKKTIVALLLRTKLKKSHFLFDSNESGFIDHIESSQSQEILVHGSHSVHGAIYCLGGAGLLLTLIEVLAKDLYANPDHRDDLFIRSIELLLQCLLNSWRINKEFVNIDGYCILALLIKFYKDNFNSSLTFKDDTSTSSVSLSNTSTCSESSNISCSGRKSLLKMFLEFSGYYVGNPFESTIHNQHAYKFLVLNFEIYSDTLDAILQQRSLQNLMREGRHLAYNVRELSKVKLLKRLTQYVKLQLLDESSQEKDLSELSVTLSSWIHADLSVDTIRAISQFVIFAFYGPAHSKTAREVGLKALQSLANELCGSSSSIKSLKKFSRSITIHWILLLLSYRSDNENDARAVVCYGILLLIKLLRVLGPHILRRFFRANKGLDVLTHFLQHWWKSDEVNCLLFLASFGTELTSGELEDSSLSQLARNKKITQSVSTLPMADFMLLLNNMALTGMYKLSMKHGRILSVPSSPIRGLKGQAPEDEIFEISFDVLHLINQYSEVIEIGYAESPALQVYFLGKEWLESAIELLGYLRLSLTWPNTQLTKNFEECYKRITTVLSGLFISKLTSVKKLFAILNSMNEITSRIVLDSIFPCIFKHINQFVENSNFIFHEKEFLDGCVEVIKYYNKEFLTRNFYIEKSDLNAFITCIFFVMETGMTNSSARKSITSDLAEVLRNAIVLKLSSIESSGINEEESNPTIEQQCAKELDENVKFLMYKQVVLLQEGVLSDSNLRQIIELLMGKFLKLSIESQLEIAEHLLNFLRTAYMMRQESFARIIKDLTSLSDYPNSADLITEFFVMLSTHNDEETIRHIQKFRTIKHIFLKNYHFRISKLKDVGTVKAVDMISVMLNNGGSLGYMDTIYIKSFEKDCQRLRVLTVNNELGKYNRELQDEQENNNFFIGSFNSVKKEIFRVLMDSSSQESDYMLDYIEGVDRMRKLLVIEDQLEDSEKLSYNVTVPIKPIQEIHPNNSEFEDYSFAFAYSGINTLSLSDNPLLGSEVEEYEEIDEVPESDGDTPDTGATAEDRNRKVLRSLYVGDQIQTIWNVSRVNGLDAVESLMILGFSHLYLTENYFHCSDGNVVDVHEAPIESRDPYLQLIKSQSTKLGASETHRTKSWSLDTLSSISKRKFLLRDCAMEMFFSDGASILITCLSTKQRDVIYNKLAPYANGKGMDRDLALTLEMSSSTLQNQNSSHSGSYLTSRLASVLSNSFNSTSASLAATKKWRKGEMSNFYYLMTLNTLAGRTFNDLTQYPVFPWVISDYESEVLDLSNPKSFRDLSKPMGAQTADRARQFEERYEALGSLRDENSPPFHYGTHYSSAMIVASYLIRLKPYVHSYLLLQGGKFDHADRLFNSVGKAWLSSSRDNTTDIRELIPEFFHLPEFLVNLNNFELGNLQSGESANDVHLPKWAKGDPKIFIAKNREALESPYVSANLHKWIDLIFGYKQSGPEAIKALNVFHNLSYDGAINLDNIKDDVEKRAVIGMINNFGQTPMRLFNKPHPPREILNQPGSYFTLLDVKKNPPKVTFESKLNLSIEKLEVSSKTKNRIGRPACASSEDELLIRKPSHLQSNIGCGSLVVNTVLFMNLHSANITSLLQIGNKRFITGSSDGVIHVWKCTTKPALMVSSQHVLRGHFSSIKFFSYSKTFKVCLSVDADGVVILWELTRFSFVRKIPSPATTDHLRVLATISNDTGNICIVHSTKYANHLTLYTINGDKILSSKLAPGNVTSVAIAALNDMLVDTERSTHIHSYWANEIIVVSFAAPHKSLQVYEVAVAGDGWDLVHLQNVDLSSSVTGSVTCMQATKHIDIDHEELLSRGHISVVLGDSRGKVYTL